MLISLYANNSVKIPLDYFPLRCAKVKKNDNNKTAAENSTTVRKTHVRFLVVFYSSRNPSSRRRFAQYSSAAFCISAFFWGSFSRIVNTDISIIFRSPRFANSSFEGFGRLGTNVICAPVKGGHGPVHSPGDTFRI